MGSTKILFIGIDAGDKDLLLKWAEAGFLPTFQSLLRKGAWGITENPPGFYVGAIWSENLEEANLQGIKARQRCVEHYSLEALGYRFSRVISSLD